MVESISDELPLEYLAAIGAVVLNFAALETSLDFTVAAIFNGLDRVGENEIPRSLDKKIGFLKKALKLPVLQPVREAANKVLTATKLIKEERHDAIHSALVGPGLNTIRVRYTPEYHVTEIKQAPDQEQLKSLALRVRDLSRDALSVAIDVGNIVQPQRPMDNPFR
jgi:hypothetical protein